MELFTRIIDEGIFIFWEEEKTNTYDLSIFINSGNKKIRLVNTKIEPGTSYYSLTHIGSGNYEIEVNVFNGSKLIETANKKVTLESNGQKMTELLQKLDDVKYAVDTIDLSRLDTIAALINCVFKEPSKVINKEKWAGFQLDLEEQRSQFRQNPWMR